MNILKDSFVRIREKEKKILKKLHLSSFNSKLCKTQFENRNRLLVVFAF